MASATADLSSRFNRIWDNIWSRFFCEKTHLFYDDLADGKELTGELPTPEEIALQIPNPCGWGTGMKNSMLNAGNMLPADAYYALQK